MRTRRSNETTDAQLELFAPRGTAYENDTDSIRPDGRKTLAPVPPEDGPGTRSARETPGNAPRSGGEDGPGTGRHPPHADPAGIDTSTGPRPGLGNGEGTLHPSPARRRRPEN